MTQMAVIDFETTGSTPAQGARATEIGVVLLEDGRVVDRYQSLMNAGVPVPPFIERLTGISNAMLAAAPSSEQVMREAACFVGERPMVAHNASFDRQFWQAELARLGVMAHQPFVCTVLLSRRLLPQAPNHRLGTLSQWLDLPNEGRAHRALADALTAAHLLRHLQQTLAAQLDGRAVDHGLLGQVQRLSPAQLPSFVQRLRQGPVLGAGALG